MQNRKNFIDRMDQFFVIHGEKVPGKGEDSFLLSINEKAGLAAVFDGCGGSGARVYKNLGGKTGAYIASRTLSETMYGWFEKSWDENEKMYRLSAETLKTDIDARFARLREISGSSTTLRGSMMKEFPSTLAAAVLQENGSNVLAEFLWSGDSRVYILDGQGLKQISADDLPVSDAMENLRQDAGMNNVVSASHPYRIHVRKRKLDHPCVVLAATDGCFGYLKTPMEFEKLLLGSMMAGESIVQWQEALDSQIGKIAGDDYTMSVISLGYGSYRKMKAVFGKRYEYLQEAYPLYQNTSEEEMFRQWSEYRREYESFRKREEE